VGSAYAGIYQDGTPRAETVAQPDMAIPNAMGLANAINFEPLGGGTVAIHRRFRAD
jgi:hypothetical protein